MDENLKKRLVGAIVLVSLAVIFVPMLLDEKPNDGLLSGKAIPDKPPQLVSKSRRLLPEEGDIRFRHPEPVKAIEAPDPQPTADSNPSTRAGETDRPSAWVIQVASFNDKETAEELRKKLAADDFPAFVKSANVKGKSVYRVRVGPELDHKRLSQMASRIDKEYKVRTAILVHR